VKISNLARSAAADAVVDLIDAGGAGSLAVRTGSAPTNTTDADSGTLLATLAFGATAFGSASSGVATANAITSDTSIDADGTAAHFRIKSGAGTVIAQGTVGTSGADINFNSVTFVTGGTAAISSLTYTQPAGS
jgi:hypothetical protein